MNTKILMMASSVFYGVIGFGLTFLPEEFFGYVSADINPFSIVTLQILGAAYLGFAMLNWITRRNPIGGIYGKPLLIANLVSFLVSSLTLIKMIGNIENHFNIFLALTIIYSAFTLAFIWAFKTNPKLKPEN
ncbi:MAG: hypothetical protein WC967_08650 [Balneolaceae bacterium]